MQRKWYVFLVVAVFVLAVAPVVLAAEYVGSAACKKCHEAIYNDFIASGHPFKLQKASEARYRPLPLPKTWNWDDISYVIGGVNWKARFVDKNGYIITATKRGKPIPTQFNLATGEWVNYHPGEKKPYKCGPCHMTGYSPEGHQDGLEGIVGTWAFPGVQCEECHGPASAHIRSPRKAKPKVDRSAAACGKCHVRGDKNKIPASKGFIRHHEQYQELLASPHGNSLQCVDCHNPHKKAVASIVQSCSDCHADAAKAVANNIHGQSRIDCVECHMAKATKSAVKFDQNMGDIRTHLFRIDTDPQYTMFSEDGKWAKNALSLRFACLGCHKSRDAAWAATYANQIHPK